MYIYIYTYTYMCTCMYTCICIFEKAVKRKDCEAVACIVYFAHPNINLTIRTQQKV